MCDGRSWCGGKADFIAAAEPAPTWAGFAFETGAVLQPIPGVYIFGRRYGERIYAVYVGEADDIARTLAAHAEEDDAVIAGADRLYWLRQPSARLRDDIVRAIVERYHPPCNLVSPRTRDISMRDAGHGGDRRISGTLDSGYGSMARH